MLENMEYNCTKILREKIFTNRHLVVSRLYCIQRSIIVITEHWNFKQKRRLFGLRSCEYQIRTIPLKQCFGLVRSRTIC